MRHLTPLRYPGGKARLANFVRLILRFNKLDCTQYVEPYGGGAGVAVQLLLDGEVDHAHINDLDGSVFAFWHSVLNNTESLCRRIRNVELSIDEWRRQRAIQKRGEQEGLLNLGFSTLYLNRTNRSGIIRSGGAIGGLRQKGVWKLDARFYRDTLIRRIEAIALHRNRISLSNLDAAVLLRRLTPVLPKSSLVYLDPPYYIKGKRRLYANSYTHRNHTEIADLLGHCRRPWLVSYDDAPQVRALYRGYRFQRYQLQYSARNRYRGAEVIFFSDSLALPTISIRRTLATRAD